MKIKKLLSLLDNSTQVFIYPVFATNDKDHEELFTYQGRLGAMSFEKLSIIGECHMFNTACIENGELDIALDNEFAARRDDCDEGQ